MVRSMILGACLAACGFSSRAGSGDAPIDAAAVIDAMATMDAPVSFLIEAEAYSSTTIPMAHQWTAVMDEAGYSGASFMQCLPIAGTACSLVAEVPTCSASLVYQIDVAQPGAYFFHARTLGRTTSENSIWYGIDGVPDPRPMGLPADAIWHWTTGDSFSLAAGAHTLHIWQREIGARVDVVALTLSSTPPP
jgi:hypothetical protein